MVCEARIWTQRYILTCRQETKTPEDHEPEQAFINLSSAAIEYNLIRGENDQPTLDLLSLVDVRLQQQEFKQRNRPSQKLYQYDCISNWNTNHCVKSRPLKLNQII
jgi:hypothetical protein